MKVTYILGAGASALSVPTLATFNAGLRIFIDEIKAAKGKMHANTEVTEKRAFSLIQDDFIRDAEILYGEIAAHQNVDIYARKLYLTHQEDKLLRAKALVSAYLIFHQVTNKVDKRYDLFLSTIFEKDNDPTKLKLPTDLLLLSWNYDFQLELSASAFFSKNSLLENQELLNHHPRMEMVDLDREILNKFSIIKLNGTVSGFQPDEMTFRSLPVQFQMKDEKDNSPEQNWLNRLTEAVLNYFYLTDRKPASTSSLLFSWETNTFIKKMKNYTLYKIYNSEILVVVGYSFPTFNRKVDREFLLRLISLKEVYIQAPADDIQSITDRFCALYGPEKIKQLGGTGKNPINVHQIVMKSEKLDDEFYIPIQATTF
ncbi:MAG: hypothetical protein IPP77_14785 [Bacteroidetes bacterium]|nr:hypothetical protein [Bacteroidota bacterium]